MSKFTKGQWMLDDSPDEYNGNIVIYDPDGSYIGIARNKGLDYIDFKTEAQANARLIAAAPEMYKLLTAVANYKPDIIWDVVSHAKELLLRIDGKEAANE